MFVDASVRYETVFFVFLLFPHFWLPWCTQSFSACGRLGEGPETTTRQEVCGLSGIRRRFMSNYVRFCSYPTFPEVVS